MFAQMFTKLEPRLMQIAEDQGMSLDMFKLREDTSPRKNISSTQNQEDVHAPAKINTDVS